MTALGQAALHVARQALEGWHRRHELQHIHGHRLGRDNDNDTIIVIQGDSSNTMYYWDSEQSYRDCAICCANVLGASTPPVPASCTVLLLLLVALRSDLARV